MRSYHYYLIRMQNILWMRYWRSIWDNLMFSSIKAKILILRPIWRPYQVNMYMNTKRQFMIELRVLWEVTHVISFQGSQLLITVLFQDHGLSSTRGNLIGLSGNSRLDILWEGISRRDSLLNPWTCFIQWYSGPKWGWCLFFSILYVFRVKVLTLQIPFLRQIFRVGSQYSLKFPWILIVM